MKYTDEFRDPVAAHRLLEEISTLISTPISVMEFCGGHTHAIMRYGLRQALAHKVRLLSGPGCPVCVTDDSDIDHIIALAQQPGVVVATFGDMVRVPGTRSSLQEARAAGAQVSIVYSALDALEQARNAPNLQVVMLGIGFETTAPTVAASLLQAHEQGVGNYYVYSLHKLTPPAMRAILDAGEVRLDAILGPGHVTAIIGGRSWEFLAREYGISCAMAGFEPVDILQAIYALARATHDHAPQIINAYRRGVTDEGNRVAQTLLTQVFEVTTATWRGLGEIPASGLALRAEFAAHDAKRVFDLPDADASADLSAHRRGCRCGDVLRGVLDPPECPLFGRACTPARPVGPCMVSGEGSCSAHYRYGGVLT